MVSWNPLNLSPINCLLCEVSITSALINPALTHTLTGPPQPSLPPPQTGKPAPAEPLSTNFYGRLIIAKVNLMELFPLWLQEPSSAAVESLATFIPIIPTGP